MKTVLLAAAAAIALASPASGATVVTADRYLDVETGRYVPHPAIFVDDTGHITSIGDARTVRWGADVKHIDLGNRTILPGLIDMHTHLSPADIGGYRFLEYTGSFWPIVATASARDMLNGGFTTMRVVGSGDWVDVGLKQAIEAGYVVGPRIVPAGHSLGATGGHCDDTYLPPELQKKEKEEGIGDSPEELKFQVRRQRKFGAEVIKVCATGGVFSRGDTPGQQQLTEDELRAIAEEAHMQGIRVAAHAHGASGINAAIRAGLGVSVLPCSAGGSDPELVACFPPPPEIARPVWLITRRELRRLPHVRALLDAITAHMQAHRALLAGDDPRP